MKSFSSFLNKNFKPIMKRYYMKRYDQEIYKVLKLFHHYRQAPMSFNEYMNVAPLEFGWDLKRCAIIFGICSYCGLIGKSISSNSEVMTK